MKKTLEKIIGIGKNTLDSIKKNAKIGVMLGSLTFGGYFVDKADAIPGYLEVRNCLNSNKKTITINRDDINVSGAKDGYDNNDNIANSMPSGYPNCYSDIFDGQIYHLWDDFRAEDSNVPYDIKLSFEGSLGSSQPNWLEFSFPYDSYGDYEFNGLPVLFQSDRLQYGGVVDVRRAIAQNNGRVDLIDVPAGNYSQWNPYGSGVLTIGTRFLGDLNDDGLVNLLDFVMLSNDWMKSGGKYAGDISGANGVPDGNVDSYDLIAFSEGWLADVNDPNSW